MKLKPKKCVFCQSKVEFLGRIVSKNEMSMSSNDVETVAKRAIPKCSKDVERFLGFVNYHRVFIKDFALKATPLYKLTGKNKFIWEEEQQIAFEELKTYLIQPPVLALPNATDPFILDTDASDVAIGGVLSQVQDGVEKVISFGSYSLIPEQKRYCTTRKELLSIVRFTRQFKHYLLGRIFTVRTDHSSLTWLLRFKDPQGQLARWMEELAQYRMIVKHRAGIKHGNADAVSRLPEDLSPCPSYIRGIRPDVLPCGGCRYCVRADSQWGEFNREVDDVVDLSTLPSKLNQVVNSKSENPDVKRHEMLFSKEKYDSQKQKNDLRRETLDSLQHQESKKLKNKSRRVTLDLFRNKESKKLNNDSRRETLDSYQHQDNSRRETLDSSQHQDNSRRETPDIFQQTDSKQRDGLRRETLTAVIA